MFIWRYFRFAQNADRIVGSSLSARFRVTPTGPIFEKFRATDLY